MNRLHAIFALAMLVLICNGCNPQPDNQSSNSAPTPNATLGSITSTPEALVAASPGTSTPLPPKPAASPNPQTNPPQYSKIELEVRAKEAEMFAKAWVENAQFIDEQTNDPFANKAVADLQNLCYGAPGELDNKTFIHYTDPKNERPNCVRFMLLKDSDVERFPSWGNAIDPSKPIIFYDNSMVFSDRTVRQVTNTYLRGLLLMHNMVHREQSLANFRAPLRVLESAAFTRELELLDKLHLSGFQSFLDYGAEKDMPTGPLSHTYDAQIEQMFGKPASETERSLFVELLYLRILAEKELRSRRSSSPGQKA